MYIYIYIFPIRYSLLAIPYSQPAQPAQQAKPSQPAQLGQPGQPAKQAPDPQQAGTASKLSNHSKPANKQAMSQAQQTIEKE